MRHAFLLACFIALPAVAAPPATERYAPDQLEMAQQSLLQARAASQLGDRSLAGRLAWQASVDARLAYGMSDSPAVQSAAAQVLGEAQRLAHEAASATTSERP